MYSEKKKRLEGAKQRLTNPPKKKKRRKPVKVIASTVENDDESDEDKVYVLKSIADDLCQPQVRKRKTNQVYMQSRVSAVKGGGGEGGGNPLNYTGCFLLPSPPCVTYRVLKFRKRSLTLCNL